MVQFGFSRLLILNDLLSKFGRTLSYTIEQDFGLALIQWDYS